MLIRNVLYMFPGIIEQQTDALNTIFQFEIGVLTLSPKEFYEIRSRGIVAVNARLTSLSKNQLSW